MSKTDSDPKLSSLNRKITESKTKHLLVENEFKKLKTLDLNYLIGKDRFEEDGTQNYLVFKPINRYFKVIANTLFISSWKSKGLSDENTKPPATSDNGLTPLIDYLGNKIRVKFSGSCLKQSKMQYTHRTIVNIYIVYELCASGSNNNDPILKNCLFGAVTLTKNTDIDKYGYSGDGIGFDRRSSLSFPGGGFGENVLEHTLSAEKMYSINFTVTKKRFCLSFHYNGANSYLFVNGTEIYKFKAKDSETFTTQLCLGNISKDWSVDKMKKTGFTGYGYGFNVDYDAIAVDGILEIHKYLMKRNNIKCLDLLKRYL